jgi:hypothetical protein
MQKYFTTGQGQALPGSTSWQPGFVLIPTIGLPWIMQQAMLCQPIIYAMALTAAREQIEWSSFDADWLDFSI